jgi:heme oxygenase
VYERWHELGRHLDHAAITLDRVDAIVAAAHEAFDCQHRWFATTRKASARDLAQV